MKLLIWLKRIVLTLVWLELLYLLIINVAFNLDITQKMISSIKPDKFQVKWKKVWSPYPFVLHLEDASAWGVSRSKKWKVSLASASAKISLLPLLQHKVHVYDIDAVNLNYDQNPVEKKSALKVITEEAQNVKASAMKQSVPKVSVKKEKKAWKIELDNIAASGKHAFVLKNVKGNLEGDIYVKKMRIETHTGPFSLSGGKVDILMHALQVGEEKEVLSNSKIKGVLSFDPIVFSQNKGTKLLSFLHFNTDIGTEMSSLKVLNIYLDRLDGTSIDGKGRLDGHINFKKGVLLPGTDVKIKADELALSMKEYRIEGDGIITAKVTKEDPQSAELKVVFDKLKGYVKGAKKGHGKTLLVRGNGLTVAAKGGTSLLSKEKMAVKYLMVDIPSLAVDNLAAFQRYVPKESAFKLYGGSGTLHAKLRIEKSRSSLAVQLLSKAAKVGIAEQTFKTNLDLNVKFKAAKEKRISADLSGSYLLLKDSMLIDESHKTKKQSKNWDTYLSIDESTFSIPVVKEVNLSKESFKNLRDLDLKKLLSTADAHLKITGNISQFDWLNLLMKNSLNLTFSGHGKIKSDLKLKKGLLQAGSTLTLIPEDLDIALLDYAFNGDGHFVFNVTKGGVKPTMLFIVELTKAQMKRRNEKHAMIDNVHMKLSGKIKDFERKALEKEIALHLQILSAKVKNIAVYNTYIPKNSPFSLDRGTADMKADIHLSTNDAKGFVKLRTHGLTMKVDEQKISARLTMDISIAGGVPKNMVFNIAGSKIILDQAKVLGSTAAYKDSGWAASMKLKKANVVWRKPIKLQSETELKIKDSRPIVAIFDNKKEKHNWLSNLMTIENIKGVATINMQNSVITFPYAFVKSDKINIGAKGIISPALRDGVFYLRYKGLKLLLKLRNGHKNVDIFHVKKTFDAYVIPTVKNGK